MPQAATKIFSRSTGQKSNCPAKFQPTAVGKNNWLFIGHDENAWKAAIFYSLIGNCRDLGIDPHADLKDVLEKLPTANNHMVAELLPANWAKQFHAPTALKA